MKSYKYSPRCDHKSSLLSPVNMLRYVQLMFMEKIYILYTVYSWVECGTVRLLFASKCLGLSLYFRMCSGVNIEPNSFHVFKTCRLNRAWYVQMLLCRISSMIVNLWWKDISTNELFFFFWCCCRLKSNFISY